MSIAKGMLGAQRVLQIGRLDASEFVIDQLPVDDRADSEPAYDSAVPGGSLQELHLGIPHSCARWYAGRRSWDELRLPRVPREMINRRRFSRLLPFFGVRSAAKPSGVRSPPTSTFTFIGKEERPFINDRQPVLAEHKGAGVLTHMWFGGDFPNYSAMRIRVFVDGEAEASIDMELGMGSGFGFGDPAAPWSSGYAGKTGGPSGIFNFYRIPFSRGVRVTAELPAGVAKDIPLWWIVSGMENVPLEVPGLTLNPSARLRLYRREKLVVEPLVEFDLCKTERSGVLFQTAIAAASENFEYLEAMMRCYVGNSKTPQYLSSGLEDYFLGTYYFNRGLYHLPHAGLTHKDEKNFSFSGYRMHDLDPILFQDGFRLTCRCGEQQNNKVFGPTGRPARTTYTTYVWTYEW